MRKQKVLFMPWWKTDLVTKISSPFFSLLSSNFIRFIFFSRSTSRRDKKNVRKNKTKYTLVYRSQADIRLQHNFISKRKILSLVSWIYSFKTVSLSSSKRRHFIPSVIKSGHYILYIIWKSNRYEPPFLHSKWFELFSRASKTLSRLIRILHRLSRINAIIEHGC